MSVDPFEPVEVGTDAPPLGPGEEWVESGQRPGHLFVVQSIPDDAPAVVREGLALRRIQRVEGECPCGGPLVWADELDDDQLAKLRALGLLDGHTVHGVHFGDCPGGDKVLVPALAAWHEEQQRD
ncbi:hypothetical protein [Microbacterium sp. NPDC077057]|uniref:hypothetical protein n=1 Tax=unclassified Microbacterium TaxID=2609290 RepID=UPI00341EC4C2